MLEPVTLDQLRVLIAIGEAGSFSAAARQLSRAQSAVSHAVLTLEQALGVALFDRSGIRRLTDGLGGVALALDPPAGIEPSSAGLALELSGAMAVDYVHGQESAPPGDLEHIRREHRYLRALLAQLDARGTLADSTAVGDLAASLGSSVHVDAALAPAVLKSLLESTRDLHREDVTLLTAPVVTSPPAFVHPDADGCAQLWDALARDETSAFVAAHPEWVSTAP